MLEDGKIYLGGARQPDQTPKGPVYLDLRLANRHGLITGATGTGKTVTLQVLAEGFSKAGVPVFCADIKGDLSGIAVEGEAKDFLEKRAAEIGFADWERRRFPTIFWDLFAEEGHPIRATLAEMGPLLLSRLIDASEPQEGVINIAFKLADEGGLPLLDLKDFSALLAYMAENASALSARFGLISKASVGSIQRALLVLEQQGATHFFGEPALKISDLMRVDAQSGFGQISVLAADRLMTSPRLYATFLLWLLSELFEELPEVGDPEKPKLVFFFDEAHLLFKDAPKVLIERVEQVVRLIRSKGVGVYLVTQNPLDVPETVLAQLGNRVQHALRAYTPREQKAVRSAAETFRANPDFDTGEAITALSTGEALVSTLEGKGAPSMVERVLIRPPSARLGPLSPDERRGIIDKSPVLGLYDESLDRESAFEMLAARAARTAPAESPAQQEERAESREQESAGSRWTLPDFGGGEPKPAAKSAGRARAPYQRETVVEAAMKSMARSVASQVGQALVRGILGSLRRR